jgi:hypothetical protein
MSNVTITTPSRQLTNAEAIAKFRAAREKADTSTKVDLDDMLYGWQLPTKDDWLALSMIKGRPPSMIEGQDRSHLRGDEDLVLYPNTMTWTVE